MPQEFPVYIDPMQDGKTKLTNEQIQTIKKLYNQGKSQRALAIMFSVDKNTIKAKIDPTWYKEKQQKRYAKKPWLDNYDTEEHTKAMRQYRQKKRALNLHLKTKQCLFCQATFTTKYSHKQFCSYKHSYTYYNHKKRTYDKPKNEPHQTPRA